MASPNVDFAALTYVEKKEPRDDKHTSSSVSEVGGIGSIGDGIHDGLEFPTDEEKLTLKRVSDKLPWAAYREQSHTRQPSISSFAVTSHRVHRDSRTIFLLWNTDRLYKLHSATFACRFEDWRRSRWPIWCNGPRTADSQRSEHLQHLLVSTFQTCFTRPI